MWTWDLCKWKWLLESCLFYKFLLTLRTRVLKNKIPKWCNLSNEALVQGQLHQKKLITPSTVFCACGKFPDTSRKHALARTAASRRVLCHAGAILRVPSRPSASDPGHVLPRGCAGRPVPSLHGTSSQLVLPAGNKIKVNKQTNRNPLVACNYTAAFMTPLQSLPSRPTQSQVLLPLSAWERVLWHGQRPVLLLAVSPVRMFPMPPLPRFPKPTRSRTHSTGSSSQQSN